MGQTWESIDSGETLKDSRAQIVTNFDTLRTTFAGPADAPTPFEGQLCFNTSTQHLKVRIGTGVWKIVGKYGLANGSDYGNCLPRTGGVTYAMTGDFYMGSGASNWQVKNVLDPTAAQDAVTKNYLETVFANTTSGHDHDGSAAKGKKIAWSNLVQPVGVNLNNAVVGGANGAIVARAFVLSAPLTPNWYVDTNALAEAISVEAYVNATELKWIQFYVIAPWGRPNKPPQFSAHRQLLPAGAVTEIQAVTTMPDATMHSHPGLEASSWINEGNYYAPLLWVLNDQPGAAGTYRYSFKVAVSGGSSPAVRWYYPRIMIW